MSEIDPTNLVGKSFCYLTVLRRCGSNKFRQSLWLCKCKCGKSKVILGHAMKRSRVKSCGCLQKLLNPLKGLKHGHTLYGKKSSEYSSWDNMIQRCHNVNATHYANYGGRGIRVCDDWCKSFDQFLCDVGLKPTTGHTIDRINNDGNYEPSNCRWATRKEQALNRRVCYEH